MGEAFTEKKAFTILTNVCFWGTNGVLMFIIGLFKTLLFVLSYQGQMLSIHPGRAKGLDPHYHSQYQLLLELL